MKKAAKESVVSVGCEPIRAGRNNIYSMKKSIHSYSLIRKRTFIHSMNIKAEREKKIPEIYFNFLPKLSIQCICIMCRPSSGLRTRKGGLSRINLPSL